MAESAIDIEVVRDQRRFLELKPEWNLLLARLGDQASVFLSHYWLDCWWRHFGGEAELHLLVLRRDGVLIAIAPLMRRRFSLYGLPVRCLCFPENGNTLHSDLLVGEAERSAFLKELLSYLDRNRQEWDLVHLHRIPVDSPNLAAAVKLLGKGGIKYHLRKVYASPYLEVTGGWQAFHAGRSVRVRKTLRNVRNSLERHARIEVVRVASWEEFLEHREEIYQVASRSWTHALGDSLATPVNRAFFEDLAREAAHEAGLRVWLLRLDGRPVAFEFHLRGFGKQHALRASFDQELAGLSPGAFLEMELLREIYDEVPGVGRFDFGGSIDPYKKRWSDQARELLLLQLFNTEPYSRLCCFYATSLIPRLRHVRDRLRRKG